MRTSLYAGIALALLAGSVHAGTFYDLGVAGGQTTGLSHNGRIAAGIAGDSAWRWAKDRGAVALTGFVSSNGMSPWAQPVAGAYADGVDNNVAALAFSNSDLVGGPLLVGAYPGTGGGFDGNVSEAYGASANGIAVGLAYDETNNPIAFRWTQADGMTRLAVNRPDTYSRANGISADGSTVVGWNDQEDGYRSGVIWQNGVALDLVDSESVPVGEALGTNSDGSIVVGEGASSPDGSSAWRWTAATGIQTLGVLSGAAPRHPFTGSAARAALIAAHPERAQPRLGDSIDGFPPASYAFGTSEDGNVIVGRSGAFPMFFATIWTPETGMVRLEDYAASHGVTIPDDWSLLSASSVSADGKTIAGWGGNANGLGSFVIDLHGDPQEAILEAHGTVAYNDLDSGPFAGVPEGTPVTMTFRMSPDGLEIEPGEDTRYPILLDTFELEAGDASETLADTEFGPNVDITNDYPLSDGIHLFSTPTASGQSFEFELFNPGGDMFDSDDLNRINRTFGPEFFEKAAWSVSAGDLMMWVQLESVSINDYSDVPQTYSIGGSVSGLEGSGLVLQQNGADDLPVSADGPFTFATALADGTDYAVTVLTQPTDPAQTCTVGNGNGTVGGANIGDVTVTCVTDTPPDRIFADSFENP